MYRLLLAASSLPDMIVRAVRQKVFYCMWHIRSRCRRGGGGGDVGRGEGTGGIVSGRDKAVMGEDRIDRSLSGGNAKLSVDGD